MLNTKDNIKMNKEFIEKRLQQQELYHSKLEQQPNRDEVWESSQNCLMYWRRKAKQTKPVLCDLTDFIERHMVEVTTFQNHYFAAIPREHFSEFMELFPDAPFLANFNAEYAEVDITPIVLHYGWTLNGYFNN
jgi:hypothetical protein